MYAQATYELVVMGVSACVDACVNEEPDALCVVQLKQLFH